MTSKTLLLVLAVSAGCSKSPTATTPTPISDPVPMTEQSATGEPVSPHAGSMLAAYERARALLAADELKGVAEAAGEIEASARKAGDSSEHFTPIATTAAKLATAADLSAARDAFGEVSRHVVALLASDKALARGQHVFECPMVSGYKKWVQPSEDLQNPYMGKRMLACGGESTWQ